jgi:hypothetical protein
MSVSKPRYQQGSITRVPRSYGHLWKVRLSEWAGGKRHQKCQTDPLLLADAHWRVDDPSDGGSQQRADQGNAGERGRCDRMGPFFLVQLLQVIGTRPSLPCFRRSSKTAPEKPNKIEGRI